MKKQIVYILTNESMLGYVKIGKTTNLEKRLKDLDNTSTPLPFECVYAAEVDDMDTIEKLLHDTFADHRVRKRREFFEVDPNRIISALQLAPHKNVTPKEDLFEEEEDIEAVKRTKNIRSRFNFGMVNVAIGTILTFSKDRDITCKIVDNKSVEFEGDIHSLSSSARVIINRMGYNWSQVQGPVYWMFENESLQERRLRMEHEG